MTMLRMRDYLTLRPDTGRAPLAMADSASQEGVVVRVAAVHSGRVNGNFRFYRPDYMAEDYRSFAPEGRPSRPVLWNHDTDERPIGRILSARYVDDSFRLLKRYPALADSELFSRRASGSGRRGMSALAAARFIYARVQRSDESYAGCGYVELEARISEPDAIERLRRGEYLTVSVGFVTDAAICSVCGADWADEGRCEHVPGRVYDGQLAFLLAGRQQFEELSFVNSPADPFAAVIGPGQAAVDAMAAAVAGMRPFGGLWQADSAGPEGRGWLDQLPEEDRGWFQDPDRIYAELWDEIQAGIAEGEIDPAWLTAGAADGRLSAEQRRKLRPGQFCGPNRTFPVPDCAHVTAALRLLGRAKVSEATRARIRACVLRKAKALGCRAASANDQAWTQMLAWMLDDIRPVAAGPEARKGDMLTAEEIANADLSAVRALELMAEARQLPEADAAQRLDALVARLRDCGWFAPADGWTESEVRLQAGLLEEILPRLSPEERSSYLDRLRQEASAFGLEIGCGCQDAAAEAEGGAEKAGDSKAPADVSAAARIVALVEEMESLVAAIESEDELDGIIQMLFLLAEKMSRERSLEWIKKRLSDRGLTVVAVAEADAADRLRQMVSELKDANRRLLAGRKRDLATQVVLLMALTGDSGFDVMDAATLEAEIDRRANRQLVSLEDSLADLQARFFRRRESSVADSAGAAGGTAPPDEPPAAAAAEPPVFLTDADVKAMTIQQAIELYRRLKEAQ